ncbi:UNVERIFIED_CONTAM: hypothetical protein Sindi_2894300, partial [Sesamum indicum]
PVACEHGGVKGGRRRLAPPPSAPGGTHTGRVWSSSSSVARDPEISSTWLAKCRQSRHARLPHGSWGMLLGALASSPSPAKVCAPRFPTRASSRIFVPTGACLGVLAAVRLPRRSNASWDGGRWLVCSGIAYVMGAVSGDWRVWACWIPARAATTSPASRFSRRPKRAPALAAVGFLCCIPIAKAFHCPERPVSPCAAPLGAAARGGPQGARCVPRPAHGRTCPGRWPIASSPDLSDAEHTVGTRASASVCPESKRSALRANDARHRFGLVPCGRRSRYSLFDGTCYSDNRSNSRANTCNKPRLLEGMHLLDKRSTRAPPVAAMIHDNSTDRTALVPATHHSNFCPIKLSMIPQGDVIPLELQISAFLVSSVDNRIYFFKPIIGGNEFKKLGLVTCWSPPQGEPLALASLIIVYAFSVQCNLVF